MMRDDEGREVMIQRREGMKRGVYLLPNLCTMASLFCGFFAVIKSLHGMYVSASWAIVIAGLFDLLDGRIARLTRSESDFGIEFDSLVDLASFGLAPGVILYTWALSDFDKVGWLVTFMFFACGALRLARFNVQADSVEKNWFQGLPIPIAAYVVATMIIFYHHIYGPVMPEKNYLILGTTVILSLLMVSTIPYRSMKQVDLKSRWSFFALVAAVGIIFVIAVEPQISAFILVLAYVAWGLIEELVTHRASRAYMEKRRLRREGYHKSGEDGPGGITSIKRLG